MATAAGTISTDAPVGAGAGAAPGLNQLPDVMSGGDGAGIRDLRQRCGTAPVHRHVTGNTGSGGTLDLPETIIGLRGGTAAGRFVF